MAIEKVYSLKIEGADSVNDLRSAIEQLNEKLQTLNQTSKEYKETLEELTKLQGQLSDAMKGISDAAGSTNQSIDGIKESLNEMGEVINTVGGEVVDSFVDGFVQGMTEAASSITVVNTNLQDLSQINSVKDLKQHISDLRDNLVTLENGSDEYKATVHELVDAQVKLKEVMNAGKNEIQAAEGSYNALSQRMSALKQVWKETTDEATRNEIGQQINEINNQLKALDASIGNSQRNVGNYKSALEGLDESFVGWKQELKECKDALQQLDPASQAYADTMARAAELTHNITEQQEMLKNASNDVGDVLTNVQGVGTNLAAGFSALNAAMGLFGEENEEVQQAMLKVQQAMALVQGMQGMDGFWKNTKKLSTQMGLATKETNKNTAATKANANASKQDALSKKAEGAATESVIPAQKGLNAAMKANPIGFIIGLIASLIAIFTLLKDKIMEMIGSNKEMSAAFDKVKAVLAGFGNVIKKSVINPIKLAIIPIKTLAKVMIDFFKGDWSKIGDDIKAGFEETKDVVVDTINVVGAFKEGYDKKTAEQNEAARKAEAAAREKELDNIIKDNEAKYGSDWKYTEEAKKLYEEMFKVRMAQYSQDSDEYREAQRDKMAYDREFQEKQDEAAKKAAEDQKKRQEAAAKKAEQDRKKRLSDFKAAFEKYVPEWIATEKTLADLEQKWKDGRAEFIKELKESYGKTSQEAFLITEQMFISLQKAISNDMFGKKWVSELETNLYNADKTLKAFVKNEEALFNSRKILEGIDFPKEAENHIKKIYARYVKTINDERDMVSKTLDKFYKFATDDPFIFTQLETTDEYLKEWLDEVNRGFKLSAEALASGNTELSMQFTEETKKLIEDMSSDPNLRPAIEKALGGYLPEFQKLLDKEEELLADLSAKELEQFSKISDIYSEDWQKRINIVKEGNQAINDIAEQNFKEQINNAIRWQGVYGNALRDLYEDKDLMNEQYKEQRGQLERLREMYNEMANDERLTFEEKERAKREAANITGDLIQLEFDKEVQRLKIQKGLWKEWANAAKDAASGVATILGSLNDYYTANMALEQQRIDQLLENNEISKEEAEKRYQQQEENFNKAKNMEAAMTIINGLSAAIGAYQSLASIPYVGPFLGAAAAAAALAASIVNAQKIRETTMENPYKETGGGGGSTNFQLPSVMELEPDLQGRMTGQSNIDGLNNAGRGRGEPIECYVVESQISAKQELANRRRSETTF